MHDNIAKMARLIRQRPAITARSVAEALGYAEPKSVYYWLGKIGFTFKSFKEAVLSGIFLESPETLADGRTLYAEGGIPIAEGFSPEGSPLIGQGATPFGWPGATFAFMWDGPGYSPHLESGDWLVIAPESRLLPQFVLLLDPQGRPAVARLLQERRDPTLVEVGFGRVWGTPFPPLVGRVAAIVRPL